MNLVLQISWSLVIGLLSLACEVQAGSVDHDFLLTGVSAGRVVIGAAKDGVAQAYPAPDFRVEEVDLLLEGIPVPALNVYRGGQLLMTAELDENVVYRIWIKDRQFSTREGIRIGSTLQQVEQQYGRPDFIEPGEDGVYAVFAVPPGRLSIRLDIRQSDFLGTASPRSRILDMLVLGAKKHSQE